ncbi:hypothetical protein J7I80_11885 [Bacillus sp. ISL-41]|uniref:hypothetical protein n=1 Tax=Bacillus sp. ISL-41 TaxID=2819127 RepID=UPI001BEC5AC1|nr:hypothetical protein [Bacillus sp. ISL-41]MBT2642929.1 hypothetical protein [Bacillus sp. ISL-41]
MRKLDKSYLGWGISLVAFLVISVVDQTVFIGVWPSTLPVILLVTHALYFKEEVKRKWRIPYWVFALLFLTILYFSIPQLTYNQAKEIVIEKYEIIDEKEQTIPVMDSGFHPFAYTRFYSFKFKAGDAEQRIMVNPDTGKIIVLR